MKDEETDFARGTGIADVKSAISIWKQQNGNPERPLTCFGIGGYHELLPPPEVREAEIRQVSISTIYPPVNGWLWAREAVAGRYLRACNIELNPETEVSLGCGGREILFTLMRALITKLKRKKGKQRRKVIMTDPCYGGQYWAVKDAGGVPVCVPCGLGYDYFGEVIRLLREHGDEILAVFVDLIHNPTGFVPTAQQLTELAQAAADAGVIIISDAVYRELVYAGDAVPSMLTLVNHREVEIVEIISGSKLYAMSDRRIGAIVGTASLIALFVAQREHINYGPASIIEAGYAAALTHCDDSIGVLAGRIGNRAQTIHQGFRNAGWDNMEVPPRAGIFQLATVPERFPDGLTFCLEAAKQGFELWLAAPFGSKDREDLRRMVRVPYVDHERHYPVAFELMRKIIKG